MPQVIQRSYTKEEIVSTLRRYHRVNDAAEALGITSGSLSRLCRRLGLPKPKTLLARP
jgi:transcriptional regulator with GAF, ATPase, and Fis domain